MFILIELLPEGYYYDIHEGANQDLIFLKRAAAQFDAMLEISGISEDEPVEDFERLRRAGGKR